METIKDNKEIDLHIRYVKLFKKVIESAIKLEKNNNETFGYMVTNSTILDFYFGCDSEFMNLMDEHSIILKSKLPYHQIYFPMFILSKIINHDIFDIDPDVLIESYRDYYLLDLQIVEEGVDYDDDNIILNRMLQEEGDFWINHSGCSKNRQEYTTHVPENLIFNFDGSLIKRYFYENKRYFKKTKCINKKTKEFIRYAVEELEKREEPSGRKKYFVQKKENTKFYFGKKIIEYTLQDILEYLNEQINVYYYLELKKELDSEVKSPKMVQKLLDNGLSIDEALESIGY